MIDLEQKLNIDNKETFEYLFNSFFPRLCLYATSIIKDEDIAADIVQEVFIKIWDKKLVFVNILNFKVYLYNSVKNTCLNKIRDSFGRTCTLDNEDIISVENKAESSIVEAEIIATINAAINELPLARREVMRLKLKGMGLKEIAENMDISVNTVKSYITIAHKELKPKLQDLFIFIL